MRRHPSNLAMPLSLAALFVAACAPAARQHDTAPANAVTAEDIARNPNEPIEKLLQRKVSGLIVTRTTDGIALRVRGTTSFDGNDSPPLFVVNDLPFEPGPGGVLTGIDPYAIETIRVLKGADAALYGIRGANGVIVITLKSTGAARP